MRTSACLSQVPPIGRRPKSIHDLSSPPSRPSARPLRIQQPILALFRHALHERAVVAVDGDAAVAGDVADDVGGVFGMTAQREFVGQAALAFDRHAFGHLRLAAA